jgi:lycopene cyclase domain-containing protein
VTYTALAIVGVVVAVLVDLAVLRTRLVRRRAFWTAYGIVLFFQLIVNGVLAGLPVVRYDSVAITGLRIAYAPIEDIAFGFAMVLLTLATWVTLGRSAVRRARPPGHVLRHPPGGRSVR